MAEASDEITVLVPGLLAGDREAEERFFQLAYAKLMAWAAQNFYIPEADREDFALEVLEKVLTRVEKFNPNKAKFSTWMFMVAKHLALDRFSNHQKERDPLCGALPEEVLEWIEVKSPAGSASSVEEGHKPPLFQSVLDDALLTLSEADRNLLRLLFGTSLSASQIAAETGLTPAAVRKRKERLLERLRSLIAERAPTNT